MLQEAGHDSMLGSLSTIGVECANLSLTMTSTGRLAVFVTVPFRSIRSLGNFYFRKRSGNRKYGDRIKSGVTKSRVGRGTSELNEILK